MRPRLVQAIALLGMGGLVLAGSRLMPRIDAGRKELEMQGIDAPEQVVPPEYAFAVQAFGAFRGLLTNIAFIRAEQMKEQGRYYDAMQLAEWICKLQPRFPSVWTFHAWNMAWNISVTTHTPEERWKWVYNGVKLLRDEGLKYNPRSVGLYKQLAWIFVNKMSETTDQYHLFYKKQWAWRMHLVLGSPPDPLGDYRPDEPVQFVDVPIGRDPLTEAAKREAERRVEKWRKRVEQRGEPWDYEAYEAARKIWEEIQKQDAVRQKEQEAEQQKGGPAELLEYRIAKRAAYARIKAIADAPDTLADLYAKHPQARQMVQALGQMGVRISDDTLGEDTYWREDGLAFTFFYPYRMLIEPPTLLSQIRKPGKPDPEAERRNRIDQILKVHGGSPAGRALVRFLQKKVLREVYKLKPDRMAELTARFGPIDWRVVDAHSLYWVNEGLIAGKETISSFQNDKTNTTRLIFFSLRNLMLRNRMVFEPTGKNPNEAYINFNPDLNFIEPMHRAYLTYGRMIDPTPEERGAGETYRTGHINFLTEAIQLLYFAGRIREARHYYNVLRDTYFTTTDGKLNPAFAKSLRDFVVDSMREIAGSWRSAHMAIDSLLFEAFSELSRGNLAQYNMLLQRAWITYRQYNEEFRDEQVHRLRLPPFEQMQVDVLTNWMRQPAIVQAAVVRKAVLWRYLPIELRRSVYDRMLEQWRHECDLYDLDLTRAFPEPEGMAEYRQRVGTKKPNRPEPEEQVFTVPRPG